MLPTLDKNLPFEAAADKILADSYAMEAPFGIPTLVLRPEDHPREEPEKFVEGLRGRLSACFGRAADHDTLSYIAGQLYAQPGLAWFYRFNHKDTPGDAYRYSPDIYKEPLRNIVAAPSALMDGPYFATMALQIPRHDLSPLPGLKAEWQFTTLWHEYGHGAGASEPQADLMGGLVYRKAFGDNTVLKVMADIRALKPVLNFQKNEEVSYYGWPMVRVLDYVSSLAVEEAESMDEDTIKNMRFERISYQRELIRQVGKLLSETAPRAFAERRVKDLFEKATNLIQRRLFGPPDCPVYEIASRFALAAHRLTTGTSAYRSDYKLPSVLP